MGFTTGQCNNNYVKKNIWINYIILK
jgi:hypothetical protein